VGSIAKCWKIYQKVYCPKFNVRKIVTFCKHLVSKVAYLVLTLSNISFI